MNFENINNGIWDFLEKNKTKIRHIIGTDIIIDRLALMTDIYMPAMVQHQKIFPKYKGINKGKTVVVTGTGPSFDYYRPIPGAVHMGLNDSIFREDILYNYFFVSDYVNQTELFDKVLNYGNDLHTFFGIHYRRKDCLIPEYLREKENVETFYTESYDYGLNGKVFENTRKMVYPLDISLSPFKSYGTTLFIVFQFALWTHPDKIYLVGADCTSRHAKSVNAKEICEKKLVGVGKNQKVREVPYNYKWMVRPWKKLAEFAKSNYPDIEIVSINPVGLKGVFKDKYTQGYMR